MIVSDCSAIDRYKHADLGEIPYLLFIYILSVFNLADIRTREIFAVRILAKFNILNVMDA